MRCWEGLSSSGVKVAVTGGKGGTGKSFLAVNLALEFSKTSIVVLADLDVEAPNDYILLNAELENKEPVLRMYPRINYDLCVMCGACVRVCDNNALIMPRGKPPFLLPRLCSGCRACYYACKSGAISEGYRVIGYTFESNVEVRGLALKLVTAMLIEGEEHSSPVVIAGKKRMEKLSYDLAVIDTGAGTGSGVSTALLDSKLAIAVTEPTPLGEHDLKLILDVTSELGIESLVVINRAGIGSEDGVLAIAREYGCRVVGRIPYSLEALDSYINRKPIVAWNPESKVSLEIKKIAEEIRSVIE